MAHLDKNYPEMKEFMNDERMMLTEMEKILVDASMAYDVGLRELSESSFSLSTDDLADRLEEVKELYFSARSFLDKHDPDKLRDLEQDLRSQKQMVQQVFHA